MSHPNPNNWPDMTVTATPRNEGPHRVWSPRGTCPLCGRTHTHGGGRGPTPTLYGHRVAHCHEHIPPRGYILIPADNETRHG